MNDAQLKQMVLVLCTLRLGLFGSFKNPFHRPTMEELVDALDKASSW